SGSIAQVAFIRANGAEAPGNGQDFQFDSLTITTAPVQSVPASFANATPAPGAYSVPTNTAISVQIIPGTHALSASHVTLTVDSAAVTPTITSGSGGSLNVNYQPASAFASGSAHAVQVVAVDSGNNAFTNAW